MWVGQGLGVSGGGLISLMGPLPQGCNPRDGVLGPLKKFFLVVLCDPLKGKGEAPPGLGSMGKLPPQIFCGGEIGGHTTGGGGFWGEKPFWGKALHF